MLLALVSHYPCMAAEGNSDITRRMVAPTSIHGEFTQERHITVLPLPLVSNGIFSYRKGNEMTWQTLAPVTSTIRVTPGQGIEIADAKGNYQEAASSQLLAEIFVGVISGDLEPLSGLFTIENEVEADGWQLRLTPREKALSGYVQSIVITGSDHVQFIQFTEANGDRTDIKLRVLDITVDEPLPQ